MTTFDVETPDVDDDYPLPPLLTDPAHLWLHTPPKRTSTVRFILGLTLILLWATVFAVAIWFGSVVLERSTNNWMDGNGFTPITHTAGVAPLNPVGELVP